jgi:ribA/ribD-fused uncharacterized protein
MSAEHAYQSEKTIDELERETIYRAAHPAEAKRLGQKKHLHHLVPDWDSLKSSIMLMVLYAKFEDSDLRAKLLATNDEKLVEKNWWNDTYWGVCNGKGKNVLGNLLMEVREHLREKNELHLP